MMFLYVVPRVGKFIETEIIIKVTRDLGVSKNRKLLFNEYRVYFWDEEEVLDSCDGCTTL